LLVIFLLLRTSTRATAILICRIAIFTNYSRATFTHYRIHVKAVINGIRTVNFTHGITTITTIAAAATTVTGLLCGSCGGGCGIDQGLINYVKTKIVEQAWSTSHKLVSSIASTAAAATAGGVTNAIGGTVATVTSQATNVVEHAQAQAAATATAVGTTTTTVTAKAAASRIQAVTPNVPQVIEAAVLVKEITASTTA
jgi:hypothetical protein